MRKLSELKVGERGFVKQINDENLEQKLFEMGVTPGQLIEVERKAPFSDPIAIVVSNFLLSVRLIDAEQIFISKEGE